ncbi:MAG: hypothetical protein OXG05_11455 [Gammaproteobacteria bacterium]|nr:hypothetical protein [Gammaproteobacteria bacterium]
MDINDRRSLRQQAEKYLKDLEELFGPRDPRFVFSSIERSSNRYPHTDYPNEFSLDGDCAVSIHVTSDAYDGRQISQCLWQIAHECVHLLDPCRKGEANFLEEGLATWFQDEKRYHSADVQSYIDSVKFHSPTYTEAKALVELCMPELSYSVRRIRSNGVRLKDFTPELLHDLVCPGKIDQAVLDRLCTKFPIKK